MFNRCWLYGIAIGGLIASGVWAQQPSQPSDQIEEGVPPVEEARPDSEIGAVNGEKSASEQDKPAPDTSESSEPTVSRPIDTKPPDKEAGENTGKADDEFREIAWRDLAAQEGMSYAAWATVALTLMALFLIWRTLIHTRDAAKAAADAVTEARKATKAAEDTVAVTQDIGRRQLRAYVSAHPRQVNFIENGKQILVTVDMKNHGQTPATELRYQALVDVFPYPLPADFEFPALPTLSWSRATIHPGFAHDGIASSQHEFNEDEISAIIKGQPQRMYTLGTILYKDIFNDLWETKFCFSITSDYFGFLTGRGQPTDPNFDPNKIAIHFHTADRHNDTT